MEARFTMDNLVMHCSLTSLYFADWTEVKIGPAGRGSSLPLVSSYRIGWDVLGDQHHNCGPRNSDKVGHKADRFGVPYYPPLSCDGHLDTCPKLEFVAK